MSKKKDRVKHVPQRTCVGCREVLSKKELVRIVRTPDGIEIEKNTRLSGRGAYLHKDRHCWEKAIDKRLAEALKANFTTEDKESLIEFMSTLAQSKKMD